MLLIDGSQFLISRYMIWSKNPPDGDLSLADFRRMTRASLDQLVEGLSDFGLPAVLCLDGHKSWRVERFPWYKWSRGQTRSQGAHDWNKIYEYLAAAVGHIDLRYPVVKVEKAEADDVIGTICDKYGVYGHEAPCGFEIVVVSTDKDFKQLLKFRNVTIYDPARFRRVVSVDTNPAKALNEHILIGDRSDGIPNYLSPDDCFVTGKRQTPIRRVMLNALLEQSPDEVLTGSQLGGFLRNKELIDLSQTPQYLKDQIIHEFNEQLRKKHCEL